MKKEQKIIELRRAAKLKVAELETEIAIALSETAEKKAHLLMLRAESLENTDEETERYNVIANYRALLADEHAKYAKKVAQLKALILQAKTHCERRCAASEDDPKTMMKLPQQTVYVDGSEHSARIVARRMINKMPHIPKDGYLFVHVIRDDDGDFFVSISARGKSPDDNIAKIFSKSTHTAESESEFVEEAREMLTMYEDNNNSNSHVAEPLSRALDAVFGGNPVKQVENLISDNVKDGKEGENE